MKFKAKLDDEESREYWAAVDRGAREYDNLPGWKKGSSSEPADRREDGSPEDESD